MLSRLLCAAPSPEGRKGALQRPGRGASVVLPPLLRVVLMACEGAAGREAGGSQRRGQGSRGPACPHRRPRGRLGSGAGGGPAEQHTPPPAPRPPSWLRAGGTGEFGGERLRELNPRRGAEPAGLPRGFRGKGERGSPVSGAGSGQAAVGRTEGPRRPGGERDGCRRPALPGRAAGEAAGSCGSGAGGSAAGAPSLPGAPHCSPAASFTPLPAGGACPAGAREGGKSSRRAAPLAPPPPRPPQVGVLAGSSSGGSGKKPGT